MADNENFINWFCENYYDKKTKEHVKRVAQHVSQMNQIPEEDRTFCCELAWLHDILEDNRYEIDDEVIFVLFGAKHLSALNMLTRGEDETYDDYCKRLNPVNYNGKYPEINRCAWYVKIADMFDHLDQVDTLTNRLKAKYLSGLRYLL